MNVIKLKAKPSDTELHPVPNADGEARKLEQRWKSSVGLEAITGVVKALLCSLPLFWTRGRGTFPTVKLGLSMKGEQR